MNTLEEFPVSAGYVLSHGNSEMVLCDCGVRTFEQRFRTSLDPASVAFLKKESHLPVIADPSQATGNWAYVEEEAMTAVAAGCDGIALNVHNDPENAMAHGVQSLNPERLLRLTEKLQQIRTIISEGEGEQ